MSASDMSQVDLSPNHFGPSRVELLRKFVSHSSVILLLILISFLGTWEFSSRTGLVDRQLLPSFSATIMQLFKLLSDPSFLLHFGATALRIVVAFVIGAPLAILIGFFLGERLHLGRVLNPVIYFALAVPQSIFLPVFMLIFGIDFMQKVIFGITHVFFILCVTTIAAVKSIPRNYIKGAHSFGATSEQIYLHIYFPAMLPLLLNGLRMGMIFNITGVLLAEMYSSRTGLGSLIFHWGENFQMTEMLAAVLLISIITVIFNEAMRALESAVSRWSIRGVST